MIYIYIYTYIHLFRTTHKPIPPRYTLTTLLPAARLHSARLAKADEVKAALREHGGKHSLFYAAQMGMPELVAELIQEGAGVHEKNLMGKTPLYYARNEETKAVFAEHAAKGGQAEQPSE